VELFQGAVKGEPDLFKFEAIQNFLNPSIVCSTGSSSEQAIDEIGSTNRAVRASGLLVWEWNKKGSRYM